VTLTASPAPEAPARRVRRRKARQDRVSLAHLAQGTPLIWLTGGGMVLSLLMVIGLLLLVLWQGLATFWPGALVELRLKDGAVAMGEVTRTEEYVPGPEALDLLTPDERVAVEQGTVRRLVRTGNYELTGEHFRWVDDHEVTEESRPEWAFLIERQEWGRFYGLPVALRLDGEVVADTPAEVLEGFRVVHPEVLARRAQRARLESRDTGEVNAQLEHGRLALRGVELEHGVDSAEWRAAQQEYARIEEQGNAEFERIRAEIEELNRENHRHALDMRTADGTETTIALDEIVRLVAPNRLGPLGKLQVYLARWREFLLDDPRHANSEGGVYPAIFGTVTMTLLMTLLVVPIGVLAALYLREYAKAGWIVSSVRIAINNLAGVPSIVFGVFGLGFFCYLVGGRIDELFFRARLPSPTFGTGGILWASLTLALLTLPVVIVATEEALAAVPNSMREGSYACGASKWQTIRRIVLPRALPGITTGMILAMARGAGEVAPLMLVGAVKLAPELPLDGVFPYVHPERSFMHLGFHIYDLGFQSQNSEAAKPMVFTTTLLLIAIVVFLNLAAVALRARLHRRFRGGHI
jgi:phosphate transport system permease protein